MTSTVAHISGTLIAADMGTHLNLDYLAGFIKCGLDAVIRSAGNT
jgi:hypothetical protein